jgi:glycosyltransferase involved in cell wall biosynthesis
MPSVSFIVPFLNEEKNLLNIYNTIKELVLKKNIIDYEIIFIDDGSIDNSKKIISEKIIDNYKVISNLRNYGLGYSLKKGMECATKEYLLWVPSDDEHDVNGLTPLFYNFGNYDLVIPHVINTEIRPYWRRALSFIFTIYIKIFFLTRIPYFNGLVLYKSLIVKKIIKDVNNFSFSFIPEVLLRSLTTTKNYKVVGYKIKKSANFNSSAFTFKNIFFTIFNILKLRFTIF